MTKDVKNGKKRKESTGKRSLFFFYEYDVLTMPAAAFPLVPMF